MGIRIAIDAMGGDNAPKAVLDGVAQTLNSLQEDVTLTLFGDEQALKEGLAALGVNDSRVLVQGTTEVIGCD